jgi:signal transduction histidine kinase
MSETTVKNLSPDASAGAEPNARGQSTASAANRETMAAVRVGLANFVHEVTNPLHMIFSTIGLIEQELPKGNGNLDPLLRQAIPRLKGEVEQMIGLVGALRAQLECIWSATTVIESVDLPALIGAALASESARLQTNSVRVLQEFPARLPPIKAVERLLKQAIVNLLRNAADAMPHGGILRISAVIGDRSVRVEIADTGIGIPPDLDIFQPFATTKKGGMGLGLAISRHIIEANGATIDYHSESGKGTIFRLTFPIAEPVQQWNNQGPPKAL